MLQYIYNMIEDSAFSLLRILRGLLSGTYYYLAAKSTELISNGKWSTGKTFCWCTYIPGWKSTFILSIPFL